jgi:hypothetical protein
MKYTQELVNHIKRCLDLAKTESDGHYTFHADIIEPLLDEIERLQAFVEKPKIHYEDWIQWSDNTPRCPPPKSNIQ